MENNSLAKISLGINAVLLVLIIVLFVKMPSSGNAEAGEGDSTVAMLPDDGVLTIGYFNTDSLNKNLLFVKELEEQMIKSQQNAEEKMIKKQKEIDAWQRKWADRGQLLPSEEKTYMEEAERMQKDAMEFEQQVQIQLAQEQEGYMMTHIMRISKFSKQYAEENGYDMIYSYQIGQNLVYANPRMDITGPLIKLINDDYNSMNGGAEDEQ